MMNISKKQVIATMMLGLLVTPLSITGAGPAQEGEKGAGPVVSSEVMKKLAKDTYIIDWKMGDVTGDRRQDSVYLIGHKESKAAHYADHLTLLVENGATKEQVETELDQLGGYEGKLFLGDFSGNGKADVMVSAATGGSGGMVDHRILSFASGQPTVIFNQENNRGIPFTGKFVAGFQAQVKNDEYGISTMIDLHPKKDLYVKAQIYDADGAVLQEVHPISYPLASLEPVDFNRDGVYELNGIQRMIGAYGADGIGNIYSSWKYENGKWVTQSIEITSFLQSFRGITPIAKTVAKIIVLTELDTNKEITVESGDIIQLKLKEISGTGYQWVLAPFDGEEMELVSETREEIGTQNGMVGTPYTKVFTLKTKKMGKFDLKVFNVRSWENKGKAANNFSITINNLPKGL